MTASHVRIGCLLAFMLFASGGMVCAEGDLVGSATVEDARAALVGGGLSEPEIVLADPEAPLLISRTPDGVTVEVRLIWCQTRNHCAGADLVAVIPATSRSLADRTVRKVEATYLGVGAETLEMSGGTGLTYAVMLDTFVMYNMGVSRRLLPDMLANLLTVVADTRDAMVAADSDHAALWRGN